jgi:hypothetical protein
MTVKYALGPKEMLVDAIKRHKASHMDELPRKIVMHPRVFWSLLADNTYPGVRLEGVLTGRRRFLDVEIELDTRAIQPKLVTVDHFVEYL